MYIDDFEKSLTSNTNNKMDNYNNADEIERK